MDSLKNYFASTGYKSMRLHIINQVLTAASWQVKSLVQSYIYLGNDSTPGFYNFSHSFGLEVFDKISRTKILQTAEDFAELVLSMYKQKFRIISGIKADLPLSEQLLKAREILKAEKCMEAACIPLYSCLKLQYLRSSYVLNMYLDEENIMDTLNSGYYLDKDSKLRVQIQDTKDIYYSLPRDIIQGCGCKKQCSSNCKCIKSKERGNVCSQSTCKCICFKHEEVLDVEQNLVELQSESDTESTESSDYELPDIETDFI